jgi:hypothetical protein
MLTVAQLVKEFSTFMESEGVSPPADPMLSHLNPIHSSISYYSKVGFNKILPSTPGSSKVSDHISVLISHLPMRT